MFTNPRTIIRCCHPPTKNHPQNTTKWHKTTRPHGYSKTPIWRKPVKNTLETLILLLRFWPRKTFSKQHEIQNRGHSGRRSTRNSNLIIFPKPTAHPVGSLVHTFFGSIQSLRISPKIFQDMLDKTAASDSPYYATRPSASSLTICNFDEILVKILVLRV